MGRFVALSHTIDDGMITYPGLPGPKIGDNVTRAESAGTYAPGVEFHIGNIEMVANTGTYLDVPVHRYVDGYGLVLLDCDQHEPAFLGRATSG